MATKAWIVAISLAVCGCVSAPPDSVTPPACAMSADDRAWIDRSLAAWRFASEEFSGVRLERNVRAIFFDAQCVLSSDNALAGVPLTEVVWQAAPHDGNVPLPDGESMPAGVTSFASAENGLSYFVMSTPSIWQAGGVSGGPIALDTMMVAVLLHEASHVAQTGPYGPRLGALIDDNQLPDDFNDDSLQRRFQDNAEIAASVRRETELLMAAATASDDAEARRLAREARDAMRARQARYFTGADAYWTEAENIWLTFEGSGQWVGYQWLINPRGGAVPVDAVSQRFVQGRWWSQTEGFALASAVDRIVGPSWKAHAFGDGAATLTEMLDTALAAH